MANLNSKERVVEQVSSSLCSKNQQIREQSWRTLVEGLRNNGREPESADDAITELLSVTGGSGPFGTRFASPEDYHNLTDSATEKVEVDSLYKECLRTAKREFPYIFEVGQ